MSTDAIAHDTVADFPKGITHDNIADTVVNVPDAIANVPNHDLSTPA